MASVYTLNEWTTNAAIVVLGSVPGLNYSDASDLVSAYLTSVGGWIPDDNTLPVDKGVAANGQTYAQAAASITVQQFSEMVTLSVDVPVTLSLSHVGLFPPGTPVATMFAALQTTLEDRVNQALSKSTVEAVSFDWSDAVMDFRTRGVLITADQVGLQSDIATSPTLTDPAAVAAAEARQIYGLDSTWMTYQMYDVNDATIVCYVAKYTDTNYVTQAGIGFEYIIGLDTVTLGLQSATIHQTA